MRRNITHRTVIPHCARSSPLIHKSILKACQPTKQHIFFIKQFVFRLSTPKQPNLLVSYIERVSQLVLSAPGVPKKDFRKRALVLSRLLSRRARDHGGPWMRRWWWRRAASCARGPPLATPSSSTVGLSSPAVSSTYTCFLLGCPDKNGLIYDFRMTCFILVVLSLAMFVGLCQCI